MLPRTSHGPCGRVRDGRRIAYRGERVGVGCRSTTGFTHTALCRLPHRARAKSVFARLGVAGRVRFPAGQAAAAHGCTGPAQAGFRWPHMRATHSDRPPLQPAPVLDISVHVLLPAHEYENRARARVRARALFPLTARRRRRKMASSSPQLRSHPHRAAAVRARARAPRPDARARALRPRPSPRP